MKRFRRGLWPQAGPMVIERAIIGHMRARRPIHPASLWYGPNCLKTPQLDLPTQGVPAHGGQNGVVGEDSPLADYATT